MQTIVIDTDARTVRVDRGRIRGLPHPYHNFNSVRLLIYMFRQRGFEHVVNGDGHHIFTKPMRAERMLAA